LTALRIGLGLDAGGTQTRWAVAGAAGQVRAEGTAPALSGLQLGSDAGRAEIAAALARVARDCGPVQALVAGVTAFDDACQPLFGALAAAAFGIDAAAVRAMSDIELACRAAFAPGAGYVVYAGTGSIAAGLDGQGRLQRAGGRGPLIDDAGGGHWIACQALRRIWRAEDSSPGAWRASALAQQVFARIGGAEWPQTRAWVYGATRGELGTLALAVAVAAAAAADPAALALLQEAGTELARLALALFQRHGPRPLVLAGRVFELHPAVEQGLRAALPAAEVRRQTVPAHHAAARLAARVEAP
jgi:N-acetylglucosamine kinase-like BadF-type ATPase